MTAEDTAAQSAAASPALSETAAAADASATTTATPDAAPTTVTPDAAPAAAPDAATDTADATAADSAGGAAVITGRRIDPSKLSFGAGAKTRHRRAPNDAPKKSADTGGAPREGKPVSAQGPQGGDAPKKQRRKRKPKRIIESKELYAKKERKGSGDIHVPIEPEKPFVYEGPAFADLFASEGGFDNVRFRIGDKVDAKLFAIGKDSAFFTLSATQEASMALGDLIDDDGNVPLAVGDTMTAYVTALSPDFVLSPKLRTKGGDPAMLEDAKENGIPVEGKVTGQNKGGIEVEVLGVRAFCPMGQIEIGFCEDPTKYVGQTLTFVVSEIKEGGRNVVVSRRKLLEKERAGQREVVMATLDIGSRVNAEVVRVADFGAFVDLGGVDALIPISELAHARVAHPSDVVSVGDKLMVEVRRIEPNEKRPSEMRISVSRKATLDQPFAIFQQDLVVGQDVSGTITRLTTFGAFVELFERGSGLEGLIHISELSDKRVRMPSDVVNEGDAVTVRILDVNHENERIGLSLKDAGTAYVPPGQEAEMAQAKGYSRGAKVTGLVDRIERYGVFIKFEDGSSALLPAPETLSERGAEMRRVFSMGDSVEALVIDVDERGRIKLSQKALKERDERAVIDQYKKDSKGAGSLGTLGDLLSGIKLD